MKPILLLLLAIATVLAAAAALPLCAACRSSLAMAGTLFYAVMFVLTALVGPTRPVAVALAGASGLHAGLVATGSACPLCWAVAACSFAITLLLLRDHAPALAAVPFAAVLGLTLAPPPLAKPPPRTIVVYERPDCPYCVELRTVVLPEATRNLSIQVRYEPAPPSLRVTPTLVIGSRTIEGLPPIPLLRRIVIEEFGS